MGSRPPTSVLLFHCDGVASSSPHEPMKDVRKDALSASGSRGCHLPAAIDRIKRRGRAHYLSSLDFLRSVAILSANVSLASCKCRQWTTSRRSTARSVKDLAVSGPRLSCVRLPLIDSVLAWVSLRLSPLVLDRRPGSSTAALLLPPRDVLSVTCWRQS